VPAGGNRPRPRLVRELDALDRAVYRAVALTPTPTLDGGLVRLSTEADHSRLWFGVAAALVVSGGSRRRRAAALGVASIALASATTNLVVKPVLARERPDRLAAEVPQARHVRMPGSTSFPSGHAASAVAFATAVSRELPAAAAVLRPLALAVAYSRVHTGVHYPGDVVFGSLVGTVAALTVRRLADRLERRGGGR
jgi:undecaprenyl-diphosphatase